MYLVFYFPKGQNESVQTTVYMELWNFAPWYGDWGPTIYHHGSLNTNIPPMDYGVIFMLKGTDRINRKTI